MKIATETIFSQLLKPLEPFDSGLDAIVGSLYSASTESKAGSLALDLAALLKRRNDLTLAARVSLLAFIYFGDIKALNETVEYMFRNRKSLGEGDNAVIKCDFVDFVKKSSGSRKPSIKDDLPDRVLKGDELGAVFAAVERLCACGILIDSDLLGHLATGMHNLYPTAAYVLMRQHVRFYGEYQKSEDIVAICNLRRRLSETAEILVSANPELWPLIRYLLAVSHAKVYMAATEDSIDCRHCMQDLYVDNSLTAIMERDEMRAYYADYDDISNSDCAYCPHVTTDKARELFTDAVKESLLHNSYLPAARLFWDIHDSHPISYTERLSIVNAVDRCRSIYEVVCHAHPVLDYEFTEKT